MQKKRRHYRGGDNAQDKILVLHDKKERSVLNCLSIQPAFVKNGTIDESFFGYVYRFTVTDMGLKTKYRIGEENKHILNNAFPYKDKDIHVIKTLLENCAHFQHPVSLDFMLKKENVKSLKLQILYHIFEMQYLVKQKEKVFIITSNQDFKSKIRIDKRFVFYLDIYLVDDTILDKNTIILGFCSFVPMGSPLIAVPLIDKQHFDSLCNLNGIDYDKLLFSDGKGMRFPMIEKFNERYSIIQSYIDNVDIPYWYIEDFRTDSNFKVYQVMRYYRALHFSK